MQCWNGILSNYGNAEEYICISKHATRADTKNDNLGITCSGFEGGGAFADSGLFLKSEVRFSGLTIAEVHLNYEKFSSLLIFIFSS